ncbi:MAG TPA: glycosyltransferase family 87 protein [Azospirillum sp.]|nr:glycosyltransferase family 87 protein [Azospirillum sp.]
MRRNWGLALWILFNAAIAVLAFATPMRAITHTHLNATLDWWASRPVHTDGTGGFPHLPSANLLFGPLALLPPELADQIWRLLSVAVLTWAVYRAAGLVRPDAPGRVAHGVLVLTIPAAALGILRGQWDVMMFAVLLHATVDLAWNRRARGALLLALAVAVQPLALVPALLFGALRPRAAPWLLAGLAAVVAAPFLHPDPAYVAGQYAAMADTLRAAADRSRGLDLGALLAHLGITPAYATMAGVRVAAALCTLGTAYLAYRRLESRTATLVTLMLAIAFLTLFDPHTDEGAFTGVAALAALALFAEHRRRPAALPVLLGGLALGLGTHVYGAWIDRPTHGWLKPTLILLLYVYIAAVVARRRTLVDPDPEPARRGDWRPDRVAFVLCAAVLPLYAGARLLAQAPLRRWLSAFEVVDYLILVVGLNLIGVAVVVATGPLWNWMRGRPLRPTEED